MVKRPKSKASSLAESYLPKDKSAIFLLAIGKPLKRKPQHGL
jgi:hypothetical protein